jgi:hypothetical protein
MLKRLIAVASAAALLVGWGVPAARATSLASGDVSDVRLSWISSAGPVRVAWSETTSVANTITFERDGFAPVQLGTTTASGQNEITVATWQLVPTGDPADVGRIVVSDPDGGQARSADFDRYLRTAPTPTLSFTPENWVKWSVLPDSSVDTTPGDPLDQNAVPTRFTFTLRMRSDLANSCLDFNVYENPETPGALSGVFDRVGPYLMTIYSSNNWNRKIGSAAEVRGTGVTFSAPSATRYGQQVTLAGRVTSRGIVQQIPQPYCSEKELGPAANELVVLQARNSSTSPWYVVGTIRSASTGQYSFKVKNAGTREYRAVVPNTTRAGILSFGATTASKVVKATTQVVSAKFIAPVITYGTRPQAYLWADPAGTQKAALQFRNPNGTWQGLTYKTLYSGRGIATFQWSRRGATPFRWYVPGSTTSTGLKVDPVYSGIFTLTVR